MKQIKLVKQSNLDHMGLSKNDMPSSAEFVPTSSILSVGSKSESESRRSGGDGVVRF